MGFLGTRSWWFEASLGTVCVILYLVYRLKKRFSYFEEGGIPTYPIWPSLKSTFLLFTLRKNFIDYLDDMYKYFDGHKLGGFYQLGTRNLLVRDPDLVRKIIIKDFSYFHDHGLEVDTEVNPLEGHLFNMNGAEWRALRNKLTPTFTTGKLRGMLTQMSDCSNNLIDVLQKFEPEEDVLVHEILSRFSMDVIGSCAFGIDAGALKDPDCEFKRMANKFFRPGLLMQIKALARFAFPKLALKWKMKTIDDEVTKFFFDITQQAFEHRMKTGMKRNDFVDLLLQLKLKGCVECDPKELTEEDLDISPEITSSTSEEQPVKLVLTDGLLTAQSFVFLLAGWENTASAISFTLYFLAKHPDAQDKARREVREMKAKHSGMITYEALRDMIYLGACISESMRLFTQAVALIHSCTKSYTMDDGRVIEKGTPIWVPLSSIHKDPVNFHQPKEFRPERFMPDHEIPNNVYLPFGDGPRVCIARRFVLLQVKEVMSNLLENFAFTVSPKTKEPIKIKPRMFVIEPDGGIWLRLKSLNETPA